MVLLRCPGRAGFQPAGELHWLRGLPARSGGGFQTRPHHGATDALGVRASSPQVSCTGCARIGLYYRCPGCAGFQPIVGAGLTPAPTMVPPRYPGRAGFQPAGELHWLCADRFVLPRCPGCAGFQPVVGAGFKPAPTMVPPRYPGRAGFQPAGELHWLCADRFVLSMPWLCGLPARSGGGFQTRPHHGATEVPWACGLPARR